VTSQKGALSENRTTSELETLTMMRDRRPYVNDSDDSDDAAYLRFVHEQLARLRAAIAGKQHWIIATDDDCVAAALLGLTSLLMAKGAVADQFVLLESQFCIVNRAQRLDLKIAAISKTVLPAESVASFLAAVCQVDPAPYLATLKCGADLVPISENGIAIAACLEQILNGRVTSTNPNN